MTSPDSPDQTMTPPEDLVDLPGFQPLPPSRPPWSPDELDPTQSTISPPTMESPHPLAGDEADWLEDDEAELRRPAPGPSSTASTERADPADLLPLAAALVGITSMGVRFLRARRQPHLPPDAWIADEEDTVTIAEPLARIAARRSPISGEGAADTADGLALVVGTANYAVKNLALEAEAAALSEAGVDARLEADDAG